MDNRKQAISIRMNSADIRNVKKLARRIGARDSDVIRFAVKVMLGKLAPLHDLQVRGRSLVPVFVESGTDLFRHFDMDAARLDSIINEGVHQEARVDHEDLQLIAMSGIQRSYARLRLSSIGSNGVTRQENGEDEELGNSLRRYLYEKYVYHGGIPANGEPPSTANGGESNSSLKLEPQS